MTQQIIGTDNSPITQSLVKAKPHTHVACVGYLRGQPTHAASEDGSNESSLLSSKMVNQLSLESLQAHQGCHPHALLASDGR